MAAKSAVEAIDALKKRLVEVYHPPPPEATEGDAATAPPPVTPEATPAPTAEGDAAPVDPAAEEAPPAEDADPIAVQQYHIRQLTKDHSAAAEARAGAEKSLSLASEALRVIKEGLDACSKDAIAALRDSTAVPQVRMGDLCVWRVLRQIFCYAFLDDDQQK